MIMRRRKYDNYNWQDSLHKTEEIGIMIKQRFQDIIMQKHYEKLIKSGVRWNKANRKTIEAFKEYDEGD